EAAAELATGVVSYALGVEQSRIRAGGRGDAQAAYARQLAMYLCHDGFELSLVRVAAAFGRDPSTVAHACHLVEDRREDAQFDLWIAGMEDALRATPVRGVLR